MPGKVFLVVRSVVEREADRSAFDHWYAREHMPRAIALLGAEEGWRYWSRTDPAIHYAVYRYADMAALTERSQANRQTLMTEYEQAWPSVVRTREAIEWVDHALPDEGPAGA